jgi:hypothetical protein
MKIALRTGLVVVLVGLVLASQFIYLTFLRPVDPLTPTQLALAAHFNQHGIEVRPRALRHGFPHSQVSAVATYEFQKFPLPFQITECPDEIAAEQQLQAINRSPNVGPGYRNGRLLLDFAMWGDDTKPIPDRVIAAFQSFKAPR